MAGLTGHLFFIVLDKRAVLRIVAHKVFDHAVATENKEVVYQTVQEVAVMAHNNQ